MCMILSRRIGQNKNNHRRTKMKKIVSLILVLCMTAILFAACGAKAQNYELGIGMAVTANNAKLKYSATVAAVVVDAEGKVVECRIDAIDITATLENGAVVKSSDFKSKAEQGDAYGMLSDYGSKLAEWDDQAKYFENAVKGKTVSEISAIKSGDAALTAGCTIDVTDFVKAVANAMNSAQKVAFSTASDITVGVSINGAVADKNGNASYETSASAVVLADGKVAAALVDCADGTIAVENGEGTSLTYAGSKLEQGDAYGMLSEYGSKLAEWYVQAKTYAATAVGKTASEVSSLATEGVAGCTIAVEAYKAAIVEAVQNAR